MKTDRIQPLSLGAWLAGCVMLLTACSQGGAVKSEPNAAALPTPAPEARGHAGAPGVTLTSVPTNASAQAAGATTRLLANNGLPGGDLSGAEMYAIAKASFNSYPWRMKTTIVSKTGHPTLSGLFEVQSPERAHFISNQPSGHGLVMLEGVVISSTLYAKARDGDPGLLATLGLKLGVWSRVPKESPLAEMVDSIQFVADPLKLQRLEELGFAANMTSTVKVYKFVGADQVNGIATSVYEWKGVSTTNSNAIVTDRVAIGIGDERIYNMQSDGPVQTAGTTMEYDPSINIVAPIR